MKSILSMLALAVATTAAPLALAADAGKAGVDTYTLPEVQAKAIKQLPTPKYTPLKSIGLNMVGTSIKMSFRIDKKGRPKHVDCVTPLSDLDSKDRYLAVLLKRSIPDWSFNPALRANGEPTAVLVTLPVEIVERKERKKEGKEGRLVARIAF